MIVLIIDERPAETGWSVRAWWAPSQAIRTDEQGNERMPGEAAAPSVMSEFEPPSRHDVDDGDALRAHTYSLLAALFAQPPSSELLHRLAGIEVATSSDGDADLVESWQVLRLAGERAEAGALDDEYHDLFIGLGRGQVMPYASWYLTGFLMDRPLAVLRGDLARLGFERQPDVKEPEDHVAALFETMAMLCLEPDSRHHQREFFQAHLEPWLADFLSDLQAAKSAVFYRALGRFAAQFVRFETRYLSMTV